MILSAKNVLNNIWEHKKRSLRLLQGLLLHQGIPLGTSHSLWVHPYPCIQINCLLSMHSEKGNSKKIDKGALRLIISAITLTKHQVMVWMRRSLSIWRRWRTCQGGIAKAEAVCNARIGTVLRGWQQWRLFWLSGILLHEEHSDWLFGYNGSVYTEGKIQGIFHVLQCIYCSAGHYLIG